MSFDISGLENLVRAMERPPKGKIGILGEGQARREAGPTNAEIGLRHEFGLGGMPIRSWLRMPLTDHLQERLEKSGAFDVDTLHQVIETADLTPWLRKVFIEAEATVQDAFDTGGFGTWKPLSPQAWERKKNKQILVETQQLRRSILSQVYE